MSRFRWLPLAELEAFLPLARREGVSKRARAPGQFVAQYRRAGGDWRKLPQAWRDKREAFLARHTAQAERSGEVLYLPGIGYSRRGLALLVWAFDPSRRAR